MFCYRGSKLKLLNICRLNTQSPLKLAFENIIILNAMGMYILLQKKLTLKMDFL